MSRLAERAGIDSVERLAVGFGHDEHAVEPLQRARLEAEHAPVLRAVQETFEPVRFGLRVAAPDLRFNVVGEDHGGTRQPPGKVDRRHQEIADEKVEGVAGEQRLQTPPIGARPVFPDGVRQRIGEMQGGILVEAP